MVSPALENGKAVKKMMQEFQEKRVQLFIQRNTSQELITSLEEIKKQILERLEEQKIQSRLEIEKAEIKKTNLIKRLVLLEQMKDSAAQDEIIKELEEYSRIRRYRDAQLAKITKEIQDLNLSQEQFLEKVKQGEKQQSSTDALFDNV